MAVIAVIAATLLKLLLQLIFPGGFPFQIYFTAIVVSAWIGGLYAGVAATVLSVLVADFVFIEPYLSFNAHSANVGYLLLFCLEGVLVSTFSNLLHLAYSRSVEENVRQKRTEQSLRESEERFRLLVDSVKDYAIFMLDPNGIITLWNSGAERIKGYRSEEIVGKPFESLYPPEELEKGTPKDLMETAIRNGSAETEGWRMRKDGTRFWASVTLTSLWKDGELRGFAKITRDMTERRRAEALANSLEMERIARQEAERANQLKTRFLAMVSHELRTPLTSMKGFATSLLSEDVSWSVEQQQQFLQIIDEEADKLRELIDQLLNLSQIEAGVLQIDATPQPFSASLDIAYEQLHYLTQKHNLKIQVPDDLPDVLMDERRIAQVIVNLVANAAKYAPAGTEIVLNTFVQNHALQVEVHDQGPGIPLDQRLRVFEAFNQLERKQNPQDGAGLGLAIAKGLVTAQGGTIRVKDGVSGGTTLAFTLPLANEQVSLDRG